MRYCKKCVMPDSRPYMKFDKEGICYPCRVAEQLKKIDWKKRWKELEMLADQYRGINGDYYDCIIAASSGKDSYFQVHVFKEKLHMNPLIVSVNNFTWTKTGEHNWNNLLKEFGVDAHIMSLNPQVCKTLFRKALEKLGSPTWYFDRAIYAYPYSTAVKLNIPLVIYGEDTNYLYGGPHTEETPSAIKQITNDVAKPVPWEVWLDDKITMKDVNPAIFPTLEQINKVKLDPRFLSYYMPWSGYKNMEFARTRGFKTLDDTGEWKRDGYLEQYDQIDSVGYLTHTWFKFPKFGHQRVTEVGSLWIREGRISREKVVEKVLEEDWKLDKKMLKDFLNYINYKEEDFWKVVDRFANRDIVEKRDGIWRLRKNVEQALRNGDEVKI
ncbi:MAG: N-acetyl sugar amidotransferase [Thermoplasmata archaeon]|nr:N-acetyl sugar amidotransferase [Thermoplasmata archaeon]MBE3140852.1 N-acetyl sugar amidotransferase [Thermoplasmata archaeon]